MVLGCSWAFPSHRPCRCTVFRYCRSSCRPDTVVLPALLLVGLVLGGSMFYVLVFPAKPKPIVCPSPTATCIDIPFGVSFDSSKNFVLSNVTITAGTFFPLKKQKKAPPPPPPTPPPPRPPQVYFVETG